VSVGFFFGVVVQLFLLMLVSLVLVVTRACKAQHGTKNCDFQHHLHISLLLREHHLDVALRRYCDLGIATDAETANRKKKKTDAKETILYSR